MNGVLILDKPAGISSARALNAVKHCLPRRTKVGHAGTLDPFATGVLLVLIGTATKSCEQLMGQRKVYEATIKLGATTETDDIDSPESPGLIPGVVTRDELETALTTFLGAVEQRPPDFSAIKIRGRRACDRIRAGETVTLASRIVQIYSIDLIDYDWPFVKLKIDCGRGTYIRSIARDLGDKLNVGGYLTQLRRTRIGEFSIDDAVTPQELSPERIASKLHAI